MSEQEKHSVRDFSKFKEMSTVALKEILRQDSQLPETEESDIDLILFITEVLAERELETPNQLRTDGDAAWEVFQEQYLPGPDCSEDADSSTKLLRPKSTGPCKKSKLTSFSRKLGLIAAALVLALGCMVIVQAAGVDVFGSLARWTADVFHFDTGGNTKVEERDSLATFPEIQAALHKMQLSNDSFPSWIPEGYAVDSINQIDEDFLKNIFITFINAEHSFINISISIYKDSDYTGDTFFEKNDMNMEEYVVHDKLFYVYGNSDRWCATWSDGKNVISITDVTNKDDLIKMIESIRG